MIELLWNAPVSEEKMARCIDALDLGSDCSVLDVGCGCGEVLIRLFEHFGMLGTGIDSSAEFIAEARLRANGRADAERIQFIQSDVTKFPIERDAFDLVMCMGATHAFGLGSDAVERAIGRMNDVVAADGLVLLADGYLKQPKPPEYREFLGDAVPDHLTHAAIIQMGQSIGLVPLGAWTTTDDEWDEFEWAYQRVIEKAAADNPADERAQLKLSQRRAWMDAYVKWGRATLGYGTYLFRKPIVQ